MRNLDLVTTGLKPIDEKNVFVTMEKALMIYCFDAYCGWCYGFSSVIKKIAAVYEDRLYIDVLSGGMILPEKPVHIRVSASYIYNAYPQVEASTGAKFGADYLWHIQNPEESDWYPSSEKPAIALCIFKSYFPEKSVAIASDLQHALYAEGRDLTDNEAYRHLLEKYSIQPEVFYEKLAGETYRDMAHQEFAMVKQLQVTGYPTVLIQTDETRFHMVARGYTPEKALCERIDAVLASKI